MSRQLAWHVEFPPQETWIRASEIERVGSIIARGYESRCGQFVDCVGRHCHIHDLAGFVGNAVVFVRGHSGILGLPEFVTFCLKCLEGRVNVLVNLRQVDLQAK